MKLSKDHNSLVLDVRQSPGAQDTFQPIPGLISCAGVTGTDNVMQYRWLAFDIKHVLYMYVHVHIIHVRVHVLYTYMYMYTIHWYNNYTCTRMQQVKEEATGGHLQLMYIHVHMTCSCVCTCSCTCTCTCKCPCTCISTRNTASVYTHATCYTCTCTTGHQCHVAGLGLGRIALPKLQYDQRVYMNTGCYLV